MMGINRLFPFALLFTIACDDVEEHDHHHDHNHGVVTSLILNFTPEGGGDTLSFAWADPEGDGDPIVDDIVLPDASDHSHHDALSYMLDVEVWNEMEDPAEDVTIDIDELAEEHQFFFTGSAVEGPATGANGDAIIAHEYADSDADGVPVGLSNSIQTLDWGSGELTVTLAFRVAP